MGMSCYEWERGTLVIPTKEWAKFRTALIKAHNDRELAKLEKAKSAHAQLKAAIKGKRGAPRRQALEAAANRIFRATEEGHEIRGMVVKGFGDTVELRDLPKKKDLKLFPTSKDASLHFSDATIVLRNKGRMVTWDVGENNHAREHSRAHPMGQKFFALLAKIKWTRGSGGKIVGNDEYNQDNDYEGGGGNYVTAEFGPEVQKRQEAQRKAMRQQDNYYRSMFGGRRW